MASRTRSSCIAERPALCSVSVEILFYCCTNNANRSLVSLRSIYINCHILFHYLNSFYFCTRIVALSTTIAQRACNAMHSINRLPYNQSCWCQLDCNCDQPVLLTIPHITRPAHHHGCKPPQWTDTKVSNSKSDHQGHWRSVVMVPSDRPHTISYSLQLQLRVYLAPFPRYYHSFPKI